MSYNTNFKGKQRKNKHFTFRNGKKGNDWKKANYKLKIRVKIKNKDFMMELQKGDDVNDTINRFTN